ncbi:MAG: class I SAM-dependent methyltransferase, partial [Gammaproteobacteria bacterium]|nr:class I SAM-dependent methyltransferase [Gammaproteobacteria bacterium]
MNEVKQDCWSLLQPSDVAFPFSWVGHIPFAMWLVCQLKPNTFVELGTHSGNSYLAICQAVKHHQLPTRCYAVDTWQGDEHAGQYDNSVYETLQLKHNERYGNFSTLLRMTFDDALKTFDDNTVDLLHIDGLHTYEAVK